MTIKEESSHLDEDKTLNHGERSLLLPQPNLNVNTSTPGKKRCIPFRYVVTLMTFAGFFNVYAMRVNLSVALVAMVNSTVNPTPNASDACPLLSNQTSAAKEGPFLWDPKTQGQILASFFYGYIITQIPGGFLASKYGAKWPFGIGVLCTTIFTLATPYVSTISPYALIGLRVLEGLGEGVTFPSAHALFSKWSPPLERSKHVAIAFAGAYCGTAVFLPIAGALCDSDFLGGWPSVFYVSGILGLIWFVFWCLLVYSSPAQHPWISQEERNLIGSSLEDRQEFHRVPWLSILTSVPMWAITMTHFCANWAFYTLLTDLPTYFKGILHFDISENGLVSSLPYIGQWIVSNTAGHLADFIRSKGILSTTVTRKVFNSVGFFLQGCFLMGAGLAGCNVTLAVVCLVGSVASLGITISGYNVNHMDIAPKYAGILLGITNTAATIPGFLGPIVVSLFISQVESQAQWFKIFSIAAGVDAIGLLVFLLLSTGVQQEWAKDTWQRY